MDALTYPHPLDYVVGIKYTLTNNKINKIFKPTPENFYVEELLDFESMGYNAEKGDYAVIQLEKYNIETLKALEVLARTLNIPVENLHIMGFKDKNAHTKSYVFIRRTILDYSKLPLEKRCLRADLVGFIRVKPSIKHHLGNKFTIIITNVKREDIEVFKDIVRQIEIYGLPSYYGYQRFGYHRCNSHILGKHLLFLREDLFADELLTKIYLYEESALIAKRFLRDYHDLRYENLYLKKGCISVHDGVCKKYITILRDAYSSYLFNLLLNIVIEKWGWSQLDQDFPAPGCKETSIPLYSTLLKIEGLKFLDLRLLPCYYRHGLFKPEHSTIKISNNTLYYEFTLKRGMYATIVLRELFKDNLVLS
jgi:tRNA pseudouridine13 synthase